MIQHGGVWLPDGEQHLIQWMTKRNELRSGVLTYQQHKLKHALSLTQGRGCVVDVGAHCGLWSMWLAEEFGLVLAFEPVAEHVECLRRNCADRGVVNVFEFALGDVNGRTDMRTDPTSSGDTYPAPGVVEGRTIVRRYDSLQMQQHVDLVKLDCEGYELFALQGMAEMLAESRPVVVVEQKPGKARKYGLPATGAVQYLEALGWKLEREIGGDFFMVPA